jgi:ABC-2 type transport system ATP-binding protein
VEEVAISIKEVSKAFKLPHEKQNSVKSLFVNLFRGARTYERQQVLKNISFDIKKGEFFGIVGRNGSGKSTLLKLLAGIYEPNKGNIHVNGKLTPFIELGVGFNQNLTGRENVYLNGALLGFNRKEMNAMYDSIVEFAELERFMDQKLKNYSSGMQVRLAFSIAIRAKSDILVLDEVLAVGDEAFQKKCIKVFDDYKKNKQTVILVTHDMETVKKYCSKALLLSGGEIIEMGNPHDIASKYSKLNQLASTDEIKSKLKSDIKIEIKNKKADMAYEYGEKIEARLSWPSLKKVDTVGVAIHSSTGEKVYASNTALDNIDLKGANSIDYRVDLEIGAGNYFIMAGTFAGKDHQIVDFQADGPSFRVDEYEQIKGEGLARLKHTWEKSG